MVCVTERYRSLGAGDLRWLQYFRSSGVFWSRSLWAGRPGKHTLDQKRIAGDRPIVRLLIATAVPRAYKKRQASFLARLSSLSRRLWGSPRLSNNSSHRGSNEESNGASHWAARLAQREPIYRKSKRSFSRKQSPLNPTNSAVPIWNDFTEILKLKKERRNHQLKKSFKPLRIRKKLENLIKV